MDDSWALKLAYTGRGYHGFQYQPGVLTVEGVLRKALAKTGLESQLTFASRTDAGVNALGFVVAITTGRKIRLDAINRCLPGDVAVWGISRVTSSFNPRYDCLMKIYKYYTPLNQLDTGSMNKAAALITGRHYFGNFAKKDRRRPKVSTILTLDSLEILLKEGYVEIEFRARSFLWQMCRRIAQHLIDVGKGVTTPSETALLLENSSLPRSTLRCPSPAPPENLFLHDIIYENVRFDLYPEYLGKIKTIAQKRQQLLDSQLKREKLFESVFSPHIKEDKND